MIYAVVAFMLTETRLHPGNTYTTLKGATRESVATTLRTQDVHQMHSP